MTSERSVSLVGVELARGGTRRRRQRAPWIRHAALLVVSLIFVAPLLWMLITALKTSGQVFTWPPVFIPHPFEWGNFAVALIHGHFGQYLLNTVALSIFVAIGTLFSSTLTAYSLARIDWKHREVAFLLVLSTLLLPDFVTLVPLYSIFRSLGLIGGIQGFVPLILPAFCGRAYFIFLMRQFMLGIPIELSDAARLDGCSELSILVRVILPLCRPALLSVTLFSVIATWSDFLQPLVYLRDEQFFTVSVGLADLQGRYQTEWPQMMAAAAISVIPILIIFFFAQKQFVRGISTTGIK